MIFYRLGLQKLMDYFKLLHESKDDENREFSLHNKPKEVYRTKLQADRTMDLCVSILLSAIGALVCISIPYAALESPCEELKKHGLTTMYSLAKSLEQYVELIDRLIISLLVILVYISITTLVDAIQNTNISMSPWLERGKYAMPNQSKKKKKKYKRSIMLQ